MKKPTLANFKSSTGSVGTLSPDLLNSMLKAGDFPGAPIATETTESLQQIGEYINAFQPRQNMFLSVLVNRIALAIITSKSYQNPWKFIKRGILETGETIEEIFVNLAKVENFLTGDGTDETLKDLFGTRKPDVRVAFHNMNFMKKYPVSVSEDQLKTAFTSWGQITNLIEYIIQSLYTAFEYDEFITIKYMVYRLALDGKIHAITIPDMTTQANLKSITKTIKQTANDMTFMKSKYNMAHVMTHTQKEDQMLLKQTDFDAAMDVDVLANAFNLDKVTFAGNQMLIDSLGTDELNRLDELFAEDANYKRFTSEELQKINSIKAYQIDRDFLMEYDNLIKIVDQYIPNKLSWNYFLHHWATFSASPFKNAVMYTTETNEVTALTVTPTEATVTAGSTIQIAADLTLTGFPDTSVIYEVSGNTSTKTYVSGSGLLVIGDDEEGTVFDESHPTVKGVTVKVTSVANPEATASAKITVV